MCILGVINFSHENLITPKMHITQLITESFEIYLVVHGEALEFRCCDQKQCAELPIFVHSLMRWSMGN